MKSLPATHYHALQGALISATKNKCVSFQGSGNFFCAQAKRKPDQNVGYGFKHMVLKDKFDILEKLFYIIR